MITAAVDEQQHIRRTNLGAISKWILTTAQPYIETHCSLGEGPYWEEETNTVRFLDVEKQELHRVDIGKGPSSHKLVKKLDISMGYVQCLLCECHYLERWSSASDADFR